MIELKDSERAELWAREVEQENAATAELLVECATVIKGIKDDADGSIFDELYRLGSEFLLYANKVQEGMLDLTKGIRDAFKGFNELNKKVGDALKNLGKLFS